MSGEIRGAITDVPGILVGHWSDESARTGCTVVLTPPKTVGSGEVRGGAPATRETDLLRPGMLVNWVDAVLLTGGSAFGLAAADGVMRWLVEHERGFDTGVARVPIVPAAALFDLGLGDPTIRPGPGEGYAACEAAGPSVAEGSVGAGTGATVAKLHGTDRAVPGGVGSASERDGDLVVGALAAVNAVGEVVSDQGEVLAGALSAAPDSETGPGEGQDGERWPPVGTNTTLVVVATNAKLSKERASLLALAGHDGIDDAVVPAHTIWDGDTVFTLATGEVDAEQPLLEAMTVRVVAAAIRGSVGGAG